MKVALYCRESSDDTSKAPDIQEQIKRGNLWVEKESHELILTFADNGFSGGDRNRPDFLRCMRLAKGHSFQIIWVWNQDRIARDTEQFLWFYRTLKESNVKVFSETEGWINMDDVGGTAKHITLALASELLRKVTSDKVKCAYQIKKSQAVKKGDKVVWGRKRKEIDIERVLQLRSEGKGYRAIAKLLNINYMKVRRCIKELQNTPQETLKEIAQN